MEYRKIEKDEFIDLRRIHSLAYFMKYDSDKTDNYQGADGNRWEYGRAAFNDAGKMVAVLEAIPFDSYLDGHIVGSPGIAGVATLVEERRRGHIKKLLQLIFNEMHENGDVMSYLFPFSHKYYRMFGYSEGSEIEVDIEKIVNSAHEGYTRQYFPGDKFDDLNKIYKEFSRDYNCSVCRKDWRWKKLYSDDPYKTDYRVLLRYDKSKNPVAYIKFKKKLFSEYTYDMVINDLAWAGDDGIMAMISLIKGFNGDLRKVSVTVPSGFPVNLFVNEAYEQKSTIHPAGMNRIINAAKALEIIKKPEMDGRIIIGLDDEYCPWNTGNWLVEWANGETQVSKSLKKPEILCKAPEFSQLITGRYELAELKNFGKVEITDNDSELSRLFVKKPCFIQDRF